MMPPNSPGFGNPPIAFAAGPVVILVRRIGRRVAKSSVDQVEAVGPKLSLVGEAGPRDRQLFLGTSTDPWGLRTA